MKNLHYKKITAVLLGLVMLLCSACAGSQETIDNVDPLKYVTLGQYKGLTVSAIDASVSEGDIEAAVMNDLESFAQKVGVDDRPVINGDTVNLDYKGTKDGKPFDGGTGTHDLEIGSGTFIPGFEEGVIGMEIGETKDLKLTFPEDYSAEDLAGQDVVFEVTVNSISENVVPSISDKDVLKKLGKKYDDDFKEIDDYLDYMKNSLEETKKNELETKRRSDLLQQVYDNAQCDLDQLPEWIVSDNSTRYMSSIESFASQYGIGLEDYVSLIGGTMDEFRDQALDYGKELAKQQLVLRAIANAENITVTDKEVEDYYAERAKEYGSTVENLKKSVDEETLKQYLLGEKVQDFLLENAVEK